MGRGFGVIKKQTGCLWLAVFGLSAVALAEDSLVLDAHPAETVLSKQTTLVLNPPSVSEKDFEVTWLGVPIDGAEASILPDSIQWVRTQDVLVLPRARVRIRIPGKAFGNARHRGATQSFEQKDGASEIEMPIALLTGDPGVIELNVRRETVAHPEVKTKLALRFKSSLPVEERIHIDTSCSSYRFNLQKAALSPHSWAFVGCRLVYTENADRLIPSLEVFLFWDGVGQKILIDGTPTESTVPGVWHMRLRSSPGTVRFAHGVDAMKQEIEFTYRLRSELHLGSFGVGFGPYAYQYTSAGGTDNIDDIAGVFTFYGSVFFNHYMRTVLFSVIPVHRKLFADTGIYLLIEQARILDTRLSVNFLLGGHGLLFPYSGANYFRFSFPQGIETVLRDFPYRRHNLMFGAFAYPFAGERSYYNIWLRWSMGGYFGELNYIKWQEIVRSGTMVGAELWGVSFGMPLFEFL